MHHSISSHHPRDALVRMDPVSHRYYYTSPITGEEVKIRQSVTETISSFFKPFNSKSISARSAEKIDTNNRFSNDEVARILRDGWKANASAAASRGIKLHSMVERYLLSGNYTSTEETEEPPPPVARSELNVKMFPNCNLREDVFQAILANEKVPPPNPQTKGGIGNQFEMWMKWYIENGKLRFGELYRSEWTVYTDDLKFGGQIDAIFLDASTNRYTLIDWKFVKNHSSISPKDSHDKSIRGPFTGLLPDTKFMRYSLQLNSYRFILKMYYGIEVDDMIIVNTNEDSVREFSVPKIPIDEIGKIFLKLT